MSVSNGPTEPGLWMWKNNLNVYRVEANEDGFLLLYEVGEKYPTTYPEGGEWKKVEYEFDNILPSYIEPGEWEFQREGEERWRRCIFDVNSYGTLLMFCGDEYPEIYPKNAKWKRYVN